MPPPRRVTGTCSQPWQEMWEGLWAPARCLGNSHVQRPAGLRALNSNNPILRLSPWLCAPPDRPTALLFLSWLSSAQRLQVCAFQKAGRSIRRERASVDRAVSWWGSPPEPLPGESGTNRKLGYLHSSENHRHSGCHRGT